MAISMQFLYVLRPSRIAMITEGATEREQEVVGRHFLHLQSLAAQGVVLMAGRTEDAVAETMGLVVFEAESADAAQRIMASDRAVADGVMTANLYPYRVVVTGGAFSSKRKRLMDAEEVRSSAERQFRRMKLLADRALEQVDDRQFFHAIDPESNSLGVIIKHVAGNLCSRWRNFLSEDGEKQDRDRDSEFIIGPQDSRDELMSNWEEGWAMLSEEVSALTPGQMTDATAVNRGEAHTVTEEPPTYLQPGSEDDARSVVG